MFVDGFDLIVNAFSGADDEKEPPLDPDAESCTSDFFKKIQLLKTVSNRQMYSQGTSFDKSLAEDDQSLLLEVVINQSEMKNINKRKSTQAL